MGRSVSVLLKGCHPFSSLHKPVTLSCKDVSSRAPGRLRPMLFFFFNLSDIILMAFWERGTKIYSQDALLGVKSEFPVEGWFHLLSPGQTRNR